MRRRAVVDNRGSDKQIAAYLEAALDDGDPQLVTAAIGDIARACGMMQLARETGLAGIAFIDAHFRSSA